jgi:hypothetical protein
LALGAAIGRSAAAMSARATSCAGTRTATEGIPAVTMSGIRSAFGRTTVSGPGQKRATSRRAASGHAATTVEQRRRFGEVDDQRIERRPVLDVEDARDGGVVGGVGAEAVDRLGGEGDDAAGAQLKPRRGRRRRGLRGRSSSRRSTG